MIWHVETALLLWLLILIDRRPDQRPRFAALLAFDFTMETAALIAQRLHYMPALTTLTYLGNLGDIPLWALAAIEAADYRPMRHRTILYWWMAATCGCAWIRFYPWTGRAVLLVNCVAYACWIWDKIRRS